MVRQLNNLDQAIISRATTDHHTMGFHALAKFVVELIAMAVPLKDNRFTIGLISLRARRQAANPITKPHGTTLFCHLSLCKHQVNHRIRALRVNFTAIGTLQSQYIACDINDSNLQTPTQSQIRLFHAACEVSGFHLPLYAAMPKTTWNDDTGYIFQRFRIAFAHTLQ